MPDDAKRTTLLGGLVLGVMVAAFMISLVLGTWGCHCAVRWLQAKAEQEETRAEYVREELAR